jgi:membrane protein
MAERAEAERSNHGSLDAAFDVAERDSEVGAGIIAGALAYRLFIWLLPFGLVLVAGLGIAAGASSESPQAAAKSVGLAGLVSNSIASAAKGSARWYALAVGIPVLLYTTRSLLRALIVAHRLAWTDLRAAAPKPTVRATVRLLVLLSGYFVLTGLASTARHSSFPAGLLVSLILLVPYGGLWLLVSVRLPHREADWRALLPGALVFGVGGELIQVVAAYFIAPWSLSKQGTYGALGIAAALLFALYVVGRLMVGTAVLNATLWDRKLRASRRSPAETTSTAP